MRLLVKKLFTPPIFPDDEEKTSRTQVLYTISLIVALTTAVVLPLLALNEHIPLSSFLLTLAVFLITLFFLYLLRRGQAGLVGRGNILVGFAWTTLICASQGTIRAPAAAMYVYVVILSGVLFGWKGITISTAASSLAILGLSLAENAGWLPPPHYTSAIIHWFAYTCLFGVAGSLSLYTHQITQQALLRTQKEVQNRIKLQENLQKSLDDLRSSEAHYQALFNQIHDAVFILDLQGRHVAVNQRAADMLGYGREEIKGLSVREISADTDQSLNVMGHLLAGEHIPLYERRFRKKDGQIIFVEINLELVRDSQGTPLHIQSVVREITERKQAEAALKAAHDALEQHVMERTAELHQTNLALQKALRAKDEFMAAMNHELRTPLTGVLSLSAALQLPHYGSLSEKQLKAVQNIENSGKRLLDLINKVLQYTQLQSGKVELRLATCSIESLCEASLRAVKDKAFLNQQQLTFQSAPEAILLQADARLLQQIIAHLLDNAVKFTPEGGQITLSVCGRPEEQLIEICVADTGIGIQEADFPRLFQPFVQLDASLARAYQGTGLGLALVKGLVELHGGHVTVQSVVGQGSAFTVSLPWQNLPKAK